jgi:hypothetical protein
MALAHWRHLVGAPESHYPLFARTSFGRFQARMNTLVLHHSYAHGIAFDLSNNRNHGTPMSVTPGTGSLAPSFEFTDPDSRINVAPSPTLMDLRAIRAIVRFRIATGQGRARRYNLMEGFVSFALYVEANRALTGTIVDAAGAWSGVSSRPGLVKTPARWHTAEFVHDGISRCALYLDGAEVARADGVQGPVRSVGNLGVTIGHWPDPPGDYTFNGHIGETQLYAYDPADEAKQFADRCCIDWDVLREERDRLVSDGWTRERLMDVWDDLLALGIEAAAAARGSSAANADLFDRIGKEAQAALLRGDADGLRRAYARGIAGRSSFWSAAQIADAEKRADKLLAALPIDADRAAVLAKALCLEHALIGDVSDLVKREQPEPRRPRPR